MLLSEHVVAFTYHNENELLVIWMLVKKIYCSDTQHKGTKYKKTNNFSYSPNKRRRYVTLELVPPLLQETFKHSNSTVLYTFSKDIYSLPVVNWITNFTQWSNCKSLLMLKTFSEKVRKNVNNTTIRQFAWLFTLTSNFVWKFTGVSNGTLMELIWQTILREIVSWLNI